MLPSFPALAQDMIITNNGDTIHCRITEIARDHIRFHSTKDSTSSNTRLIARSFVRDYYQKTANDNKPKVKRKRDYSVASLRIGAGYSYWIPSDYVLSGQTDSYFKRLRSGYNLNAALTFYLNPAIGLGIRYSAFRTKQSETRITSTDTLPNGQLQKTEATIGDDITVQSIGVSINIKVKSNAHPRFQVLAGLSPAYTTFVDKAVNDFDLKLKSDAFSFSLTTGPEYQLYKGLYISLLINAEFTFFNHVVYQYNTYQRKEKTNDLDVKRIEASLGLSYYF